MDVMPYIVYYYDVKIAIELMKSLRVEIVSNMYAYSPRVILLASMHSYCSSHIRASTSWYIRIYAKYILLKSSIILIRSYIIISIMNNIIIMSMHTTS